MEILELCNTQSESFTGGAHQQSRDVGDSEVGDRLVEMIKAEEQREKILRKNGQGVEELWINIKQSNICVIGVPEREESESRKSVGRNSSQEFLTFLNKWFKKFKKLKPDGDKENLLKWS